MTINGLNWMLFGATFLIAGCGTKGEDTGDNFEVGESDDEEEVAVPAGDGQFNIDTLYVMWNGAYRGGETAVGTTFTDSDGATQTITNQFQFIWVDGEDYTEGSEEYICSLVYDTTSATVADFSTLEGSEDAYMAYTMDLGAIEPEVIGNCAGAAEVLGLGSMQEFAQMDPWGFGYGPMTDDFADALSDAGLDVDALGDTAGTSYLRWENQSGVALTAWGYFQVVPFESEDSNQLITMESADQYVAGVADSAEPPDGYYQQETIYVISYQAAR